MKKSFLFIIILFQFSYAFAQEDSVTKKISFSGYVSSMQSVMFDSIKKNWTLDNYINNRLNFKWFATEYLTAVAEMRNRFVYGETIKADPDGYSTRYAQDHGLMDLNHNWVKGNSFLFNTNIDRLYLAYQRNKWNVTLGRQRINWGQTLVWNPNDVFNAYSFFDFDYIERPGSDAVRVQYYNTETSVTEVAVKMNYKNQVTAAAMHRFNAVGCDFQFLGGMLNSNDYFAGAGFSGSIKSLAIRSEATYFHPKNNFADTSGMLLASFETDYTFSNNLTIQAEYLFNPKPINFGLYVTTYNMQLDVKSLSFSKHSVLAQISYPITPLLNGSISGMIFPDLKGFYIGPTISYSLGDNMDFSFVTQAFNIEMNNQRMGLIIGFMRFKLNF